MGCRLNIAEGAQLARAAEAAGFGQKKAAANTRETIVVNSCAVTNEAVRQTRQTIRRTRRDNPDARLVVTGCAAQIDPAMFAAMDDVDLVLGNHEKLLPDVWRDIAAGDSAAQRSEAGKADVRVDDIMSVRETAGHLVDGYGDRARAFLQIQNGCDHRCTFCIIPYGRGPSRSAPIDEVLTQAQKLVAHGHKELVLTGVDITSWGDDLEGTPPLGTLVEALLSGVEGLYRLRLSSIDGAEIDPLLFDLIASETRIAPHVHLSVQSGDDLILKRMKRRHSRDDIIKLCTELRAARPEIAFGADIIAGFPTETEEMFAHSLALIDEAGLTYLHVFPFSPRDGAPAARMPQTPSATIKARAETLRTAGRQATQRFLDAQIGKTEWGIVETGGRARLGNFAEVALSGNEREAGSLCQVRITGRKDQSLIGDLIEEVISAREQGAEA